ncbi:putative hydrolase [Isoptericola jiangsuensis]|uniref:Putative hydrolase n=1 Tax=Isoptericola jiangsuensis TaxID=548579 RepID=A0A2A9EUI1_9MICO|nr:zinc-dependent metalloprotease [Isoptericola jiangsuensis]PFG42393.1 putative hydrolase [Isoptericola jiangsuensis]
MSDLPEDPQERDRRLHEALRGIFGDRTDEVLAQMRAQGLDPAALMGGAPPDPGTMQRLMAQLQRMFTGEGPVNTEVAHDLARQVAVAEGDPSLNGAQARSATEALKVAELWLDAVTDLPPSGGPARAWSRSEWVEATLPAWQRLVAPVAASVADALATVMRDQLGDGPDALGLPGGESFPGAPAFPGGMLGGMDPAAMMRGLGSAVFGMQVGQAAGTLSREVFGSTDVGVPLLDEPATVLLPTNVAAFADGLDSPYEEVQLYVALREAAHARLFVHVPWLKAHLHALVEQYARGITIDLDALEAQVRDVDMSDPEALRGALSGDVFGLQHTPEQESTLLRLETALALVEGWVSEVAATAALAHLPHSVPLREMIRRRRAAGGPAEHTFRSLVGLELRPRRSRDAAALFAHLLATGGPAARDAVWEHPDLLPGTEDLDDPTGYEARRTAQADEQSDVDAALAQIFGDLPDEPGSPADPAS